MDLTVIRGCMNLLVLMVIVISLWSWATRGKHWNAAKTRRASVAMGIGSLLSLVVNHHDGAWFWGAAGICRCAIRINAYPLFIEAKLSGKVQSYV